MYCTALGISPSVAASPWCDHSSRAVRHVMGRRAVREVYEHRMALWALAMAPHLSSPPTRTRCTFYHSLFVHTRNSKPSTCGRRGRRRGGVTLEVPRLRRMRTHPEIAESTSDWIPLMAKNAACDVLGPRHMPNRYFFTSSRPFPAWVTSWVHTTTCQMQCRSRGGTRAHGEHEAMMTNTLVTGKTPRTWRPCASGVMCVTSL